jgi:hypothetical protein
MDDDRDSVDARALDTDVVQSTGAALPAAGKIYDSITNRIRKRMRLTQRRRGAEEKRRRLIFSFLSLRLRVSA